MTSDPAVRVTTLLTAEEHDALKEICEREQRSMSKHVRWLIRQDIDRARDATEAAA